MAYPAEFPRTLILKARRDTIMLVVAVTAVTFGLSSAIHSHPDRQPQPPRTVQQEWTGDLASLSADGSAAHIEPLTSASLVVPTSTLKLPAVPVRELVKLRGCYGGACQEKTGVPTPIRRPTGDVASARRTPPRHGKPSLMARLNPFNHLPDMTGIRRPFAVAGDTVSGWFRGL